MLTPKQEAQIVQRGREYEQNLPEVTSIGSQRDTKLITDITGARALWVDTSALDFVAHPEQLPLLRDAILTPRKPGVHRFAVRPNFTAWPICKTTCGHWGWPVLDDLELVAVFSSMPKREAWCGGPAAGLALAFAAPCRHFHLGEQSSARLVVDFWGGLGDVHGVVGTGGMERLAVARLFVREHDVVYRSGWCPAP